MQDRERLLDDVTSGYYTHRQPDCVVVDSIYEEALEGLKYDDPIAFRADEAKLKSARKIYDRDDFQVYALR